MGRGGQNKTHGTTEHCARMDSFEVGRLLGRYSLTWPKGDSICADCGGQAVGLSYRYNGQTVHERVELSTTTEARGPSSSAPAVESVCSFYIFGGAAFAAGAAPG